MMPHSTLSRAVWAVALVGGATALIWLVDQSAMTAVRRPAVVDGWALFIAVVLAVALRLRKAIPVLPILDAVVWARVHVVTGLVTVSVFFLHTVGRLPTSLFDTLLWTLFVVVAASGVGGWILSRLLPPRLRSQQGGPEILQRIPARRAALAAEAATVVNEALRATRSQTLRDLYVDTLEPFLRCPADLGAHLLESRRPVQRLRRLVEQNAHYLDARGREALDALARIAEAKIDLDHQTALLRALRLWTLVHVPLTYGLLVLVGVHLVAVYAFSMGGL